MNTKIKNWALLVGSILLISAFAAAPQARAAGDSWEAVGDNSYLSDTSHGYPSLAFHPSTHDLYVAIVEEANSIQVKHYTGTAWENVGSAIVSGELDEANIAFNPSTEELYLAYWDITLGKIVVLKYAGSSWTDVGTHGVANGSDISFTFKPGTTTPYLAYRDQDVNKLVVKMFSGSSWDNVGPFGLSSDDVDYISLAFNPSTKEPYVAFEDDGNGEKLGVLKYNGSGWENVGPAGVSNGKANYIDLAFDESTNLPYIVYTDNTANYALKVKKFDGSAWQDIGNPMGDDPYGVFGQIAFCPSTNALYVAYFNNEALNNITVRKYNGSSWELVGAKGFNSYVAINFGLGFHSVTNEPFLIFEDIDPYDSGPYYHLGVYKFNKAVSNRPTVNYARKKSTKRSIAITFKDLNITTKKAWVKVWLGGKKVKVKSVKRSGNNLKVTLRVKYGKWARGNYNLRMQFKKKTGSHTHTDNWRSQNAFTIL